MTIKVSTGLANSISDRESFRQALNNGRLLLFGNSQAASADAAASGSLLATITVNSGAFTGETLPKWTVVLASSGGSVDSIKIGGIELLSAHVDYTVGTTETAALVAAAINASFTLLDFSATSSGANVYVTGPKGSGATLNSMVCTASATTMTATPSSAGAVTTTGVTAVNGLQFTYPAAAGVFALSGTWSGVGAVAGTVASFRYCCDAADTGLDSTTVYRRLDGYITATGGIGDVTVDNVNVSVGQVITVTGFNFGINLG